MLEENQSETEPKLDNLLAPYFAKYYRDRCYPGLLFQQGKRQMVQINIPARDLPTLLQAKPSTGNDPDSGKNRPEVKGHAEEIKEYILDRVNKGKPWILGTLTANVAPDQIKIIELGRGICLIVIPSDVKLDITDGQHRKSAIHDLIESANSRLIGNNDFPITLVLEGNFNQCQTDFKDMAQTRQLDKSLLLSFGEFEGQVGITKNLVDHVPMFYGKTDKVHAFPSTRNKLIYTTNYLARFVSCTFADDPSNDLEDYDVEEASRALITCLKQFFAECSDTRHIFERKVENLKIEEVAEFKEECILGRSVGLEVLGRLLYCTYDRDSNYFDAEKVSQVAQLDWSRKGHTWQNNIVMSVANPKDKAKPYKIVNTASSVKVAVSLAKASMEWM